MSLRVLIQMSGAPGAGKSTMAKLLRQSIGGLVINHDVIKSSLLEDDSLTFDRAAKSAYSLQWAVAEDFVQQGHSIIIDSTCNFPEVVNQGLALAKQYGLTYWYIECKVDDINLLDERLLARNPMKSQRRGVRNPPDAAGSARKDEDSHAQFRKWIDAPCRPERNVIVVNSTEHPNIGRDRILQQILSADSAWMSDTSSTLAS